MTIRITQLSKAAVADSASEQHEAELAKMLPLLEEFNAMRADDLSQSGQQERQRHKHYAGGKPAPIEKWAAQRASSSPAGWASPHSPAQLQPLQGNQPCAWIFSLPPAKQAKPSSGQADSSDPALPSQKLETADSDDMDDVRDTLPTLAYVHAAQIVVCMHVTASSSKGRARLAGPPSPPSMLAPSTVCDKCHDVISSELIQDADDCFDHDLAVAIHIVGQAALLECNDKFYPIVLCRPHRNSFVREGLFLSMSMCLLEVGARPCFMKMSMSFTATWQSRQVSVNPQLGFQQMEWQRAMSFLLCPSPYLVHHTHMPHIGDAAHHPAL